MSANRLLTEPRFVTGTVLCAAPRNLKTGECVQASSSGFAMEGIALNAAPKATLKATPFCRAKQANVTIQVMGVASVLRPNPTKVASIKHGKQRETGMAKDFNHTRLGTVLSEHRTLLHPTHKLPRQTSEKWLMHFNEPVPTSILFAEAKRCKLNNAHPLDVVNRVGADVPIALRTLQVNLRRSGSNLKDVCGNSASFTSPTTTYYYHCGLVSKRYEYEIVWTMAFVSSTQVQNYDPIDSETLKAVKEELKTEMKNYKFVSTVGHEDAYATDDGTRYDIQYYRVAWPDEVMIVQEYANTDVYTITDCGFYGIDNSSSAEKLSDADISTVRETGKIYARRLGKGEWIYYWMSYDIAVPLYLHSGLPPQVRVKK